MKTPSAPISDAILCVSSFKHDSFVRVQEMIVRCALDRKIISPADIPEDLIPEWDRQGVASNAWNMLVAMEIIERLPLTHTDPERGIYGGRIQNTQSKAKGRWTAAYRLKSRALAFAWMEKNKFCVPEQNQQQELI